MDSLNLAFTFTIFIIFITLLHSYTKAKKLNLYQTLSSFFSIAFCIYVYLTVDRIFNIYYFARDLKLKTIVSVIILFLIFLFSYIIIKIIIKLLFRFFYLRPVLRKKFPFGHALNFVLILTRNIVFLAYLIVVTSLFYNKLYFSGITKPIVNAKLVDVFYVEPIHFVDLLETTQEDIASFTDLFSLVNVEKNIKQTKDLLKELEENEKYFYQKVYVNLASEDKEKISDNYQLYFNKSLSREGILFVLLNEDLYADILEKPKISKMMEMLIKIPYLNKLVYKDYETYEFYNYLTKNQELINWLYENKTLIQTIDENDNLLLVIKEFYHNYDSLSKIKDKTNKSNIEKIKSALDDYYTIQNWILETMNEEVSEEILIEEIQSFLASGKNLDSVIVKFNQDYKKGKFSKFSKAYKFSTLYIKNYRNYSLKIEHNLDPHIRLTSAALSDLDTNLFTNEYSLHFILNYINSSCFQTTEVCDTNYRYDLVDMILWGLFTEEIDGNLRISSKKLDSIFEEVDQMKGYLKDDIIKEFHKLHDKLILSNRKGKKLSYIEEYYQQEIIQYDVLKVWYQNDKYISNSFRSKLQKLIK